MGGAEETDCLPSSGSNIDTVVINAVLVHVTAVSGRNVVLGNLLDNMIIQVIKPKKTSQLQQML